MHAPQVARLGPLAPGLAFTALGSYKYVVSVDGHGWQAQHVRVRYALVLCALALVGRHC